MSKRARSGQRSICLRQWPGERPFTGSMKAPLLSHVSLSFPAATSIAAGIAAVCTSLPSTFSIFCSWIYLITLWSCWCHLLRSLWQQSLQIHFLLCVEVLSCDCFTVIFLQLVSANTFCVSGFNKQLFSIQLTHSLREFVKFSNGFLLKLTNPSHKQVEVHDSSPIFGSSEITAVPSFGLLCRKDIDKLERVQGKFPRLGLKCLPCKESLGDLVLVSWE